MSHLQTGDFACSKPSPFPFTWVLGVVWYLLMATTPCAAAEPAARIESVQVGFRGVVEVGRWTPASVVVSGTAGTEFTPRITAADVEGRPCQLWGSPTVLADSPVTISMVYQHGPIDSPVIIELLSGSQVIDKRELRPDQEGQSLRTVTQQTEMVLCLGQSLFGFELAAQIANDLRKTRPDVTAPLLVQHYSPEQLSELPADARGWESIDVCTITADCQIPEPLGLVIQKWIHEGGRLILTGGEQISSATSPGLASWLPVRLNGVVRHRDLTSLNRLLPGSPTLRVRDGSLQGVRWSADSGVESADGALVVRSGESQGIVTAISLDLNVNPFVDEVNGEPALAWDALPNLCRWLADLPVIPKLEEGSKRPQSDLNPTGVSDLQTQLVNTLDRFPEVIRPNYWIVLGATVLFMVIVGPLDYLIVHRLLRRPHWTWLTLPIWIGLGTMVGLSAASRTEGTRELSRQLDLVTWDVQQGEGHLDSWYTIFSPEHRRYEISCQPGSMITASDAETHLRWAGRPEAGFRGLYRATDIDEGASMEQTAESRSIRSLPIRQGGSVVLEAKSTWKQTAPLTHELVDKGDGHLHGTFSHQFEGEIVDWVLAYGSFAYLPQKDSTGVEMTLKSGQVIRADQVPSRILADKLVQLGNRTVLREDRKSTDYSLGREVYNPLSDDMFLLLRTATFNQVVGGAAYTGLSNSTLKSEDLTPLVGAHRAVVFGRWRNAAYQDPEEATEKSGDSVESLAAQYSVDGRPVSPRYRECFVRWILPVKQSKEVAAAP